MGVPHITSFCWCLGLETGAKVVAVAHLLAALVAMTVCSVFAASAQGHVGTVDDAEDHLYSTVHHVTLAMALVSAAHVLLACTLFYSIYKRKACGVRAWVYLMLVLFALALVFIVVSAAMRGMSGSGTDIFLSFLEALLFFGILAYCILCVYSYYLVLKSSEDMDGPSTDF